MLHLDTNILVSLTSYELKIWQAVHKKMKEGELFSCSAITWSEYSNSPCSSLQVKVALNIIEKRVILFDRSQAEMASFLFNETGRRRGSHSDCMIAASAIHHDTPIVTRNTADFQRFTQHGLKVVEL